MKRISFAALAVLAACAPAATPAAPSAAPTPEPAAPAAAARPAGLNPVGVFQFTTSAQGEAIAGTIEVTGQPGAYAGRVRTEHDDIPITGVTVDGQQMVVRAYTPSGELAITVTFTGNDFAGGWTMNGESGEIRGQRVP